MTTLDVIHDAISRADLAILYKQAGQPEAAATAFAEARKVIADLGPLSITGRAFTVVLEDAEAAEVAA